MALTKVKGLGLGTLDDNITFSTSGKGVHLGVTSATASNLLDDFEEGTWTPTYIVDSGTNPTVTYNSTSTVGLYVKIGAFVHVQGRIRTTATSGGSGNLVIGGLPFVCFTGGNGNEFSTVNFGFTNQWAADNFPVGGYIPPNQSYIFIVKGRGDDHRQGIGLVISATTLTDGTNKNDLLFSATYRTD